jgi:hypothetical protein
LLFEKEEYNRLAKVTLPSNTITLTLHHTTTATNTTNTTISHASSTNQHTIPTHFTLDFTRAAQILRAPRWKRRPEEGLSASRHLRVGNPDVHSHQEQQEAEGLIPEGFRNQERHSSPQNYGYVKDRREGMQENRGERED